MPHSMQPRGWRFRSAWVISCLETMATGEPGGTRGQNFLEVTECDVSQHSFCFGRIDCKHDLKAVAALHTICVRSLSL